MGLFRVSLNPSVRVCRALCEIWSACEGICASERATRWWIGAGPTFFENQPLLHSPAGLRHPFFNGDESSLTNKKRGDVIVVIGTEWKTLLHATQDLAAALAGQGHQLVGADVGSDCGTERGHIGFLDGTSNLQELSPERFNESVFVQNVDDPLFAGGTYLVLRKYEENVEMWEDLPEPVQEQMIGRRKTSGAFLSHEIEWSPSVWDQTLPNAHIRLAHLRLEAQNWQDRFYRRSVKFTERSEDGIRCGLLFIALCRSPQEQVVRIHNSRLLPEQGPQDLLLSSGYVKPLFSGTYFLPRVINQLSGMANAEE